MHDDVHPQSHKQPVFAHDQLTRGLFILFHIAASFARFGPGGLTMGDLASNNRSQYVYQPLDLKNDSIRLVRLLPTQSPEGLLQLELWHNVVCAQYRCVSYRWGDQTVRHKIVINGCLFTVGSNLHDFLQEIHTWGEAGSPDALWIDAICIDQGCLEERGHQVQRMGAIYSKAQEVFVWLGDHGVLANAFHEWLHATDAHQFPSHLRQQWDTIRFNPYWSRAWIKQEILLGKKVTVVLRGASIEWTVLGSAIARSGHLESLDNEHAAHLWSFWGERWKDKYGREEIEASSQPNLFSFWSLMHMHRTSDCSDKRDRVYSLLGLVDEAHSFPVDYEETVADLFWRVGEYFDAWSPELVDILKVALLDESNGNNPTQRPVVDPWCLAQSVRWRPDMHVRIPIRRVTSTKSFTRWIRKSVRCRFSYCSQSPPLQCTRDDLLICTNAVSDEPTEHGCIHAIAHPLDKPAAEPFEVRITAHHRKQVVTTTLPSTAVQIYDTGTDNWYGVSTWSSLENALKMPDLDRVDRVKLFVPASYAIWIWFGVHPNQLNEAYASQDSSIPSAHHALPNGTKIAKNSIELPAT